ncbi:hypothetical protein [Rhizobium leguminosarum]|uniref:hypothetical protein n=1 Tax=Rhizobium leguminosarum TaxID=384 RepID=UPI0024B380DF|nr:hypothetical protein [Rhizobium leguminosarum]WHO79692.1 hypothetical protein QMO81_002386 [Rhizobium leguminosarum]
MTGDDALALLDRAIVAMQMLREKMASVSEPEPKLEAADDFPDYDLLDTTAAAERFGIPRDRLTRWARETEGRPDAIGKKVGGRWMISASRIRALKL